MGMIAWLQKIDVMLKPVISWVCSSSSSTPLEATKEHIVFPTDGDYLERRIAIRKKMNVEMFFFPKKRLPKDT